MTGCTFNKSQENIYLINNMDDIKVFSKNEKERDSLTQMIKIYCLDIRIEFGFKKSAMHIFIYLITWTI